jgi:methylenetetrahydrofolate dehydrogenase (NADP+) / methenyltetrahydrofolate cyclohydrolase
MDGRRYLDDVVGRVRAALDVAGSPSVWLATVVVGGDDAAHANAAAKHRAAAAAGLRSRDVRLAATAGQAEVEATVSALAADPAVDGVFVQLPLPAALDPTPVLDCVPPEKDVDGLSAGSVARLVRGEPGYAPCTAEAVLALLDRAGVTVAGRRAVVVGASPYVAMPAAILLHRGGAVVTLADADAGDLAAVCRAADIVVSAADRAGLVGAGHVRPGAAVVDCGVTRAAGGVVGDVDIAAVDGIAGALAPMPGGVGPATIACLLAHTLDAARGRGALRPRA